MRKKRIEIRAERVLRYGAKSNYGKEMVKCTPSNFISACFCIHVRSAVECNFLFIFLRIAHRFPDFVSFINEISLENS